MKAKLSACLHAIDTPLCASVERVTVNHRDEPYYYLRLGEVPYDFVAFLTADQLREIMAAIAAAPGIATQELPTLQPITARPAHLTAPEFTGESDMERARRIA
jgi:hypothetical protein